MEEIDKCSKCGGKLEKGFILGYKWSLKWSDKSRVLFMWEGENIGNPPGLSNLSGNPYIEAKRCPQCRLGCFSY